MPNDNILQKINRDKQAEVDQRLHHISRGMLEKGPQDQRQPLDFKQALLAPGLSVIAEIKKASPSKGLIRADFDPLSIAQSYQQHGAACISCLTEEKYFLGSPEYLKAIRSQVSLPLLRKDFMVDLRQVRESYDMGADAILLIVASLNQGQILDFMGLAQSFGLTCLVEVHDEKELETALECQADLIGINNRNLVTFETSLETSLSLKKLIPPGVVTVSESGIKTPADCQMLQGHLFDAILVGESLMRQPDPGAAITQLLLPAS